MGAAVGVTVNPMVMVPSANNFFIVDLGEIRIDYSPIGTNRWEAQIQGLGQNGAENVSIDQIYFQPLDDAAGYVVANPNVASLTSATASDTFNHETTGNLNGQTADAGGVWTEPVVGAGYYQVNASIGAVQRSGADASNDHYALLGPSATTTDVSCDIGFDTTLGTAGDVTAGVFARYTSATQFFGVLIGYGRPVGSGGVMAGLHATRLYFCKANGGAWARLSSYPITVPTLPTILNVELIIDTLGNVKVLLAPTRGAMAMPFSMFDSDLAAGGALASGRTGIWESATSATTMRQYDNFFLYPSISGDAVLFGNCIADLRYDGMFRADPSNTYFGPAANVVGDLPRVPPSGVENRPVELFLMTSRGDLASQADVSAAAFHAQLRYRPVFIHRI
jgi:hypothetical protein